MQWRQRLHIWLCSLAGWEIQLNRQLEFSSQTPQAIIVLKDVKSLIVSGIGAKGTYSQHALAREFGCPAQNSLRIVYLQHKKILKHCGLFARELPAKTLTPFGHGEYHEKVGKSLRNRSIGCSL